LLEKNYKKELTAPHTKQTEQTCLNFLRLLQRTSTLLIISNSQDIALLIMADRRRNNGPPSGTRAPVYASLLRSAAGEGAERPQRTRKPTDLRKICTLNIKTKLCNSQTNDA
jgi:hypothetical protein